MLSQHGCSRFPALQVIWLFCTLSSHWFSVRLILVLIGWIYDFVFLYQSSIKLRNTDTSTTFFQLGSTRNLFLFSLFSIVPYHLHLCNWICVQRVSFEEKKQKTKNKNAESYSKPNNSVLLNEQAWRVMELTCRRNEPAVVGMMTQLWIVITHKLIQWFVLWSVTANNGHKYLLMSKQNDK